MVCHSAYALAGDESLNWHPLIRDFLIVAHKLDEIGFQYIDERVVLVQ